MIKYDFLFLAACLMLPLNFSVASAHFPFSSQEQEDIERSHGRRIDICVFAATMAGENTDLNLLPPRVTTALESISDLLPYESFQLLGHWELLPEAGTHEFPFRGSSQDYAILLEIGSGEGPEGLMFEKLALFRGVEGSREELWSITPEFAEGEPLVVGTSKTGAGGDALVVVITKQVSQEAGYTGSIRSFHIGSVVSNLSL